MYSQQFNGNRMPPSQEVYKLMERQRRLEEVAEIMHDAVFESMKEEILTMSKRIIQLQNEIKMMATAQESLRRDYKKEAMRVAMEMIKAERTKPEKEAEKQKQDEELKKVVQELEQKKAEIVEKKKPKVKLVGNKYIESKETTPEKPKENAESEEKGEEKWSGTEEMPNL